LIEAGQTLGKAHAELRADTDFALARAYWSAPADRSKAVRLARQAREVLAGTAGAARKVSAIDAWLATTGRRI
jgi:hypothetical protein